MVYNPRLHNTDGTRKVIPVYTPRRPDPNLNWTFKPPSPIVAENIERSIRLSHVLPESFRYSMSRKTK